MILRHLALLNACLDGIFINGLDDFYAACLFGDNVLGVTTCFQIMAGISGFFVAQIKPGVDKSGAIVELGFIRARSQ